MLTYLLCIVCFLYFIHLLFNYNYRARLLRKLPGPNGAFLWGNATETMFLTPVTTFDYLRNLGEKYSTINKLWTFPYGVVNVYQPEDVEILIASTKHNKKNLYYDFLESWLQEGLLLSHGDKWQHRRKILMPAFNTKVLKQFSVVFDENGQRLIGALRDSQGAPINVIPVLSEFTLHTICETAMGIKLREEKTAPVRAYIDALVRIGRIFVERCNTVYYYPNVTYKLSSLRKREMEYANIVHTFTKGVIDEKRSIANGQSEQSDDFEAATIKSLYKKSNVAFLDLLLLLQNNGLIDEKGIHEEVNTFMFEGHDTTACGLTFVFFLLANNKHIQNKVLDELYETFGESDRTATVEDLSEMRYMERCIKESLRLYPPVPMIGRLLSEETVLSGYRVPAGTHCAVHIYDIHRRGDLYNDPLVFDPDRFLLENSAGRHPYAYLPFSAGPRNCIGQKFAMLEMKSLLVSVLREFELEPITSPADLEFPVDIVLKCAVPVNVRFVPRKK